MILDGTQVEENETVEKPNSVVKCRCEDIINSELDLSGKWQLGFTEKNYTNEILLPGILQDNGFGTAVAQPENIRWGREYEFEGVVWLEREFDITKQQENQIIIAIFERCHWEVAVYINGDFVGKSDNLSARQTFDITGKVVAGKNIITLRIDNTLLYSLGNHTHHFTKDTQGNWCGIIGDMKLEFYSEVYISDIKIYTDIEQKSVSVKLNYTSYSSCDDIVFTIGDSIFTEKLRKEYIFTLGEIQLWDEWTPNLYELKIEHCGNIYKKNFGFRKIEKKGKFLYINGDRILLRGSHDACVFPLSGAPPMDTASWVGLFMQYKKMGLNHFRAHSWCPPRAAFDAADIVGIYIQAEGPVSGTLGLGQSVIGESDPLKNYQKAQDYILKELLLIQQEYGNNPSLCMLSIGNELYTDYSVTSAVVDKLKANDNRHLICGGSNNNWAKPHIGENDDFFVGFMLDRWHGLLRGSYHSPDVGHINNEKPSTKTDYSYACDMVDIPVITHELGQYCAYPNYNEIEKYTGAMKAHHLEYFRELLVKNKMAGMDKAFSMASGKLQQRLYKEECEANLRTADMSGFQLLDIKDFPGQRVALCGVLDVFGDEKEYFDAEMWRDSCNDIVPLLLMDSRVFSIGSEIVATVKVANYSNQDINSADVTYSISHIGNEKLGDEPVCTSIERHTLLTNVTVKKGGLRNLGKISIDTSQITKAGKYLVSIYVGDYKNTWEIWLYNDSEIKGENEIVVTYKWNLELENYLENGGCAVYLSNGSNIKHTINGAFQNNFWSYRMFERHQPAGTLGMYIDNTHPLFNDFPSDYYSNFQWFNIARYSTPLDMSYLSSNVVPIVQPIDTYERNLKLGTLIEVGVGKGRLLISTFDFGKYMDNIEVRALYNAILGYMNGDKKVPVVKVKARELDCIFRVETDSKLYNKEN